MRTRIAAGGSLIRIVSLAAIAAFAPSAAFGDMFLVAGSGVYTSAAPKTLTSAPGQAFTFAYYVDTNAPDFIQQYFVIPSFTFITKGGPATFTLGGQTVLSTPTSGALYDDAAQGGGLTFDGIKMYGPQLFSDFHIDGNQLVGLNITIVPGVYDVSDTAPSDCSVGCQPAPLPYTNGRLTISAVPEPASVVLLATIGILSGISLRRRRPAMGPSSPAAMPRT